MSVLIQGVDMPKSCNDCRFNKCPIYKGIGGRRIFSEYSTKRHPWCPIKRRDTIIMKNSEMIVTAMNNMVDALMDRSKKEKKIMTIKIYPDRMIIDEVSMYDE